MKGSIICWIAFLILGITFCAKRDPNSTNNLTDPLATAETKALYRNLHQLPQKGILFGHQDALAYGLGWQGNADGFNSDVYQVCGKFPAVFGWDLGHIGEAGNIDGVPFDHMKIWIVKAYTKGGINTISWHTRIPETNESAWTQKRVLYRLLPGGDLHKAYLAKLDLVAAFLADLKGPEGELVPVILRIFHEHNGSWFWWGAKWSTPHEYKQIWRLTIDYLRKTKGLHNIITAYSPDRYKGRREYLERYPGDDYVDIIAHDNYQDFVSIKTKTQAQKSLDILVSLAQERNKVAALSETGVNASDVANARWWTDVLLEIIKTSPKGGSLAWVLVWRNARVDHCFAAFPGAPCAENFKAFERNPFTLFMEDLPPMYK